MRIVRNLLRRTSRLAGPLSAITYATVGAAGSSKTDAAALTGTINSVTGADDTKGVILPAGVAQGDIVVVVNTVANKTLKVYPPAGKKINGGSADAALVLLASQAGMFISLGSDNWVGA